MEIRTKVVLVEDDEDIRVLAEKALRGGGYEVFSAADGESGLQLVKEKRPALVILDLMMPRMHGFTVCQAVRSDPSLRHIAILVTSAKTYPVDVARAREPATPTCTSAMRSTRIPGASGLGHSTWKDALESAHRAGAAQLALFHHDPAHDDAAMDRIVSSAREYMNERGMRFNCFAAADNMLVRI